MAPSNWRSRITGGPVANFPVPYSHKYWPVPNREWFLHPFSGKILAISTRFIVNTKLKRQPYWFPRDPIWRRLLKEFLSIEPLLKSPKTRQLFVNIMGLKLATLECQINGGGCQISRQVRKFSKIDYQGGANNHRGVKIFPKTARIYKNQHFWNFKSQKLINRGVQITFGRGSKKFKE